LSEILRPLSEFPPEYCVDVGVNVVVMVEFVVISGIQLGSLHIFFKTVKLKEE